MAVLSQAVAETLVRRAVLKTFSLPGGPVTTHAGTVAGVRFRQSTGEYIWRVTYEDGDEEELEYEELMPILLPPAAPDAPHAAAPAAAAARGGSDRPRDVAPLQRPRFPRPEGPRYVGVQWSKKSGRWKVLLCRHGELGQTEDIHLGLFPPDQAEAAARKYDAAARQNGRTAVNFPVPGTGETQAVWQPCSKMMLQGGARRCVPFAPPASLAGRRWCSFRACGRAVERLATAWQASVVTRCQKGRDTTAWPGTAARDGGEQYFACRATLTERLASSLLTRRKKLRAPGTTWRGSTAAWHSPFHGKALPR